MYGDGSQVRDWLFVEDHCAGIELALKRGGAGEVYNIGGGEEATNREITDLVLEHTGADASLVRRVEDRAGHDRRYSLDTTKARTELGWAPRTPLAEGFGADGLLVRGQPRLVGADQAVGRLQGVLRQAVRRAARRLLSSPAQPQLSLGVLAQLVISLRAPCTCSERFEELDDAVALSERAPGVGKVVARVRLGQVAASPRGRDTACSSSGSASS